MAGTRVNVRWLREQWQDEGEAVFLYHVLADLEPTPQRRELLQRLAAVEHQHQVEYARLLREAGVEPGEFRPGLRSRVLAWLAHRGAARAVMSLRLAEEAGEVKQFLQAKRQGQAALYNERIVRDEAHHAQVLKELSGSAGEPWHRIESGGFLRNVIYGFNDGLTANFGLVMGVVGAQVAAPVVLLAGLAGAVADALSMGGSGYLAATSEAEVYRHELAIEAEEMRLMPALEAEELALLYEAKGIPLELARQVATHVVANPQVGLQEMAREELGISAAFASPLQEGVLTGVATAFGALIPILPYFLLGGLAATVVSFTISMLSHFLVGAARSFFTGRGIIRSGFDMFVVGLGVAIVGYIIGYLLTGQLVG